MTMNLTLDLFENAINAVNETPMNSNQENEETLWSKTRRLSQQSAKNRLSNLVQLCPDLYADIFLSIAYESMKNDNKNAVVNFMMSGQEALNGAFHVLKRSIKLEFFEDNILIHLDKKVTLNCDYKTYHKKLVQIVIPHATHVCFDSNITETRVQFFFDELSKDQRQKKLSIFQLKTVNDCIIDVLQKLNEKNVVLDLEKPSDEVLESLPSLKLNVLTIHHLEGWLHCLKRKSFLCTFSKLVICATSHKKLLHLNSDLVCDHVKEVVVDADFDEPMIFERLKKSFPNAQKLTINSDYRSWFNWSNLTFSELKYGKWIEAKNTIEEAPQQEITVNYRCKLDRKVKLKKLCQIFGWKKVDKLKFQWISKNNKSKMVNFLLE